MVINDFFLLHGVTSAWCLCQIVPHLTESSAARETLFHYLSALLMTYVAVGAPQIDMGRLNEDEESRYGMWWENFCRQTM